MTEKSAAERLGDIYEEHAPALLRLARALLDEPDDAEDVVQEAFARLYGRFRERGEPSAVYAYLRRTIINLTTDRLRRLRVRRTEAGLAALQQDEDPGPTIDEAITFDRALAKLPSRQRAALVLRFLEDLSEQQTADVLECSPAAVKQLVARGLRALRQDEGNLNG